MIKKSIQKLVGMLGYRIVPRDRDTMTLRRYIDALPIRTVIDVGANNGVTSRDWLAIFPDAHVHSIEALDRYLELLRCIAAEADGRMTVWPVAASDSAGEATFYEHVDHPSSSSLLHGTETSHELLPFTRKERAVTVSAARLDALFEQENVELRPDVLMKLDVQGAELKVLRGCEGFLDLVKCIIFEVNLQNVYDGQPSFMALGKFMADKGLDFAGVLEQFHASDDSAVYLDAVFLRS